METKRSLKKNIKEGIVEIENNGLKDIADILSLIRWSAWVNKDARKLYEMMKK